MQVDLRHANRCQLYRSKSQLKFCADYYSVFYFEVHVQLHVHVHAREHRLTALLCARRNWNIDRASLHLEAWRNRSLALRSWRSCHRCVGWYRDYLVNACPCVRYPRRKMREMNAPRVQDTRGSAVQGRRSPKLWVIFFASLRFLVITVFEGKRRGFASEKSQVRDDQQSVRSISPTTVGQSAVPSIFSARWKRYEKFNWAHAHTNFSHLKMWAASAQGNIFYYAFGSESSDRSKADSYCSSENLSFHASHVLIGIILSSASLLPKISEIPFC